MKLVLIGMPGAGKSTQGNLLSKQLGLPYLSTGHIFREIAKEKSKKGRFVKERMRGGLLIPDKDTLNIVGEYLSRPEYTKGYILDGFPRTVHQAKNFKNGIDTVIYLEISDKEALWRLAYRNAMRHDDTVEAIKRRIEIFHKTTKPVLDFYRKKDKLAVIDGTGSIESVNRDVLKHLGRDLVAHGVKQWKQKQKILLAFVGLPGSGKTEAADYIAEIKKIPSIRFGQVINGYIKKKKLSHTPRVHKRAMEYFRRRWGMAALAKLNHEAIAGAFATHAVVVIDGLRSWEEYKYLKDHFKKIKIVVIAIHTQKNLRYERIKRRPDRATLVGETRDRNELLVTNMGPTIASADYIVQNNGSVEDFRYKLLSVYHAVYFS